MPKQETESEKQHSEPTVVENVNFRLKSPITVVESIQNNDNQRKIKGMALPAQESRNGYTYTLENIQGAKFSGKEFIRGKELLIGLNHSEDVTDNVGKWTPTFEDNGIGFKGVAFNTQKHPYMTDMLDKGLMPFVSIEAMADLVKEEETVFAKNLDILGMDFVKHPGMPDANVGIAEAFDAALQESPKTIKGDDMTKEEIKVQEEEESPKQEEPIEEPKEEKKEETVKAPVEEKEDSSLIDKVFEKLDEQTKIVSELAKEVKEIKEKPQSRGVVTEKSESKTRIITEKSKGYPGHIDIYSEEILY